MILEKGDDMIRSRFVSGYEGMISKCKSCFTYQDMWTNDQHPGDDVFSFDALPSVISTRIINTC
jgi:hypothetical protein